MCRIGSGRIGIGILVGIESLWVIGGVGRLGGRLEEGVGVSLIILGIEIGWSGG